MKTPLRSIHSTIKAILLTTCVAGLTPQIVNAAPFSWDPSQTPATPSGGTGPWDIVNAFWANGGADSVWGNSGTDSAIFGGTPGTVTIGGTTINTSALTFNVDGYTVTGGTLNFSGATPTITNGASVSTTLTSILTSTNELILEGGSSGATFTINNASNTLSGGIQLNSGRLTTNTAGSLGTNVLTLNGGRFLPRTNLSNDILVTADSSIDTSTVNSNYTLGNLSIGNQTLDFLSTSNVSNGRVTFGSTTLTGNATFRTNKGSSSQTPGSSATFGAITVGDSVATATTTTLTMNSNSSSVNRTRQMDLNGVLSDNASDATKILALDVSAGNNGTLIVNVGGANTYTGATTISGLSSFYPATATLRLTTGNDRLPTGTILTINGGSTAAGVLDLNSFNQTVGGLVGGSGTVQGSVTNNAAGSGTATLTVSSTTTNSTFDGLITDGATAKVALTKAGAGTTLTLTGLNTYTGSTTINAGTLLINGSSTGSAVSVSNTGAILSGTGTITPGANNALTVNSGAILAPGVDGAAGMLTVALGNTGDSALFNSNAKFVFELDTPGSNDVLAFTGMTPSVADVTFNDNVIDFTNLGGLAAGSYTLFTFDADNTYSGTMAIGTGLESFGGSSLSYNANSIVLNVVPEPGTCGLLAAGLAALLFKRRRKV